MISQTELIVKIFISYYYTPFKKNIFIATVPSNIDRLRIGDDINNSPSRWMLGWPLYDKLPFLSLLPREI